MHSSLRTIDHMMIINDGMLGSGFTSYKNMFNMKHHFPKNESHTLEEIAKLTGYKKKGLQTIFNKGVGAYHTNPLSVRKQVKSPEQWAMGRVYASINPDSKAYQVDKSHLIKGGMIGGMAKVDKTNLSKTEIRKGNYYGYQPSNIDEEMEGNMFIRDAIENDTDDAYELRESLGLTNEEIIKKLNEEREALYKRYDTLGIEPLDQRIGGEKEEEEEEKSESESEEEKKEEDEGEEKSESESEEEEDEEGTFTNDFGDKILPYENDVFIEVSKEIPNFAKAGEQLEIDLTDDTNSHQIFDYIFNNTTPQKVYNTGNINNPEYTDEFKKRIEKINKDNAYAISQGNMKPKLDYYLFDFFVGNKEACELKCLSKSYKDYQQVGFINLVQNKITGTSGEFKPIYKTIGDKKVLKQIVNEYKDFGVKKSMNTMKNENIDYRVMYFLKDGIYYYEPLKDPNFTIDVGGRGKLNYDTYTTKYGVVEYEIPVNKLKYIPKNIYNKIFK